MAEQSRHADTKSKQEIVNLLADSEISRRIEVEFSYDVLNFSASTRYLGRIRHIDDDVFYIVLLASDGLAGTPSDDAFEDEEVHIFSLDQSFADGIELVESYCYDEGIGHIFGFSNMIMKLAARDFLRVPFNEKMYVSVIREGIRKTETEEIEIYALNLSGSGVAVRCRRGLGLTRGTLFELKVSISSFPGYDADMEAAVLTGQVIRVFPNDEMPNWENLGLQFVFDGTFTEFQGRNQIASFSARISLAKHQQKVEAELDAKYGSAFKKKKRRFQKPRR